jgi:hypothetical protein
MSIMGWTAQHELLFQKVFCRNGKKSAQDLKAESSLLAVICGELTSKEIPNGITEGLNNNAKVAFRKARGYRSFKVAEIALYHQMGKLPKPKLKHEFF